MTNTAVRRWSRWRLVMWAVIAALLLSPLVAMQFTSEVAWDAADFAAAGALLIGGGAVYEVAALRMHKTAQRVMVGAAIVAVVMLIWAQGAVGVF